MNFYETNSLAIQQKQQQIKTTIKLSIFGKQINAKRNNTK